jgi:hypothetical protein
LLAAFIIHELAARELSAAPSTRRATSAKNSTGVCDAPQYLTANESFGELTRSGATCLDRKRFEQVQREPAIGRRRFHIFSSVTLIRPGDGVLVKGGRQL